MYIPGIGYINSPQDLLQNSWVIFGGVFILAFAVTFYSIKKFFGKGSERYFDFTSGKYKDTSEQNAIPAVIAGVIAFFTAAAVSQDYLVYQIFGNVLGVWILVFTVAVLVLLSIPFVKALKSAFGGKKGAGIVSGIILGFAYWFLIRYVFPVDSVYSLPYNFQSTFNFLITQGGLLLLIIVGVIFGLALPVKKD